jgi:hypothetical protein
MMDYQVIISLQVESLQAIEAKAESLRAQIERKEPRDPEAERRLETIERVLGRLYGERRLSAGRPPVA